MVHGVLNVDSAPSIGPGIDSHQAVDFQYSAGFDVSGNLNIRQTARLESAAHLESDRGRRVDCETQR